MRAHSGSSGSTVNVPAQPNESNVTRATLKNGSGVMSVNAGARGHDGD